MHGRAIQTVKGIILHPGKTEALMSFLILITIVQCCYYFASSHSVKVIFFGFLSLVVLVGTLFLLRLNTTKEAVSKVIFPIVFFILGITSLIYFPMGTIPDEPYHFYRSYAAANTFLNGETENVRAEDYPLFNSEGMTTEISNSGWDYIKEHLGDTAKPGMVSIVNTPSLNPNAWSSATLLNVISELKIPSAIGIVIGMLFNFNHVLLFFLGRFFNFIFAFVLIVLAVRLIPIGKNAMMLIALFPMTLHLLGSYSYDAGNIALSFLLTALILRAIVESRKILILEQILIIVVAAALVPCKLIYIVIAFLALFIPSNRFISNRNAMLFKLAIVFFPLAVLALTRLSTITGLASSASSASSSVGARGTETGTLYSLGVIFDDPLSSALFFIRSLEVQGMFWLQNIPGDSLGWFQGNTSFPDYVSIIILLLLALSMLKSSDDNKIISGKVRIACICLFLVGTFGAILSMWTGWTFVSDFVIQGVQGRYFLPLIPLFLLGLRPKSIQICGNSGYVLMSCLIAIDFMCWMFISAVVAVP